MAITRTKKELAEARNNLQGSIAFVPTMGALHSGHISLVHEAKKHAENVVVSIFVNPIQFGAKEDFGRYPKTFDDDSKMLNNEGVAILYAPDVAEVYSPGFSTRIHLGEIENLLCGSFRPGHFSGVATVVAKLFNQVKPEFAVFGEKDFQQLCVVRKMVEELDFNIRIIGVPTMREADGLAISSRNRYLNDSERIIAAKMYEVLNKLRDTPDQLSMGYKMLIDAGFTKVDYIEVFAGRILAAAWLGQTRLIDNVVL